jgi:hypothetical protein
VGWVLLLAFARRVTWAFSRRAACRPAAAGGVGAAHRFEMLAVVLGAAGGVPARF